MDLWMDFLFAIILKSADFNRFIVFNLYIYIYIYIGMYVFKEVSYAHQGCIYLIQNTEYSEIVLQFKITYSIVIYLKYNLFLWSKAEFSGSLLQSSVSHDPSEIILIC